MTEKPVKNVAASVQRRLLNLCQSKGGDYNALLIQYAMERFLYRLSKSTLVDQFILKGAMLFRIWSDQLHRPTNDLDLLGFGEATPAAVKESIRTILAIPVPEDGLWFDPDSVTAVEIREEQEYGGIRVTFRVRLGNARMVLQVDIEFGDVVLTEPKSQDFPSLLDLGNPRLRMYPPETVLAEKLEAIVSLGMANSRMKGFYDLLILRQLFDLDEMELLRAIGATFHHRQTPLPTELPLGLSEEFAGNPRTQQLWTAFLRRLRLVNAPVTFVEVVQILRNWLWPLLEKARNMK